MQAEGKEREEKESDRPELSSGRKKEREREGGRESGEMETGGSKL